MKEQDFINLMTAQHAKELQLHKEKFRQYATKIDALINFKDGAKAMGQTDMEYCLTLAEKHRQALLLNARGETHEDIDMIKTRIEDIRLYMLLYLGLAFDHLLDFAPAVTLTPEELSPEILAKIEGIS